MLKRVCGGKTVELYYLIVSEPLTVNMSSSQNESVLQNLARDFLAAFSRKEYKEAVDMVPKIKMEFAKTGILAPTLDFSKEDLAAARQLLEIAIIVSIFANKDQTEIERLISEVQAFYSPSLELPPSGQEEKVFGIYLLLALTNNRTSEFHSALEGIEDPESNKYMKYPILLERWLMEGAYDKAWKAITDTTQFPSKEFMFLMKSNSENLEATIRNEIALCLEKGYDSLPAASAKYLLYLKSDADLETFVAERAERGWELKAQSLLFKTEVEKRIAEDELEQEEETNEENLIGNLLEYAAKVDVII